MRPEINQVTLPEAPYALQDIQLIVDATEGAPEDRIIAYAWDFLGDGAFQAFPENVADYRYLEAGSYQLTLRVQDPDSMTEAQFAIDVRPITLSDLLREIDVAINEQLDQVDVNIAIENALAPNGQLASSEWVNRGLWSEARRDEALNGQIDNGALELYAAVNGASSMNDRMSSWYRGNTLLAIDELLFRLNRAQVAGARFGALTWKLSRQLLRETEALAASAIVAAEESFANNNSAIPADEDPRLESTQILLRDLSGHV